jgi:NAD(P)-dependent dehydrogenase (short-subunit alcohol dehydrogenase family)
LLTGAGGGIGTAIALKLADEGCNLVLSDRDAASLERTQAACAQRGGFALRILAVRADLSNRDDVARLAKEAATAFGAPLDFLVNNGALCLWPCFAFWALTLVARSAGVMDASDFATQTVESIERMVATDLMAPMLLTRLLLPGMIARRQGIIITISSMCVGLRCCFALTQRGIADARVTAAWAFFRRPSAAYTALPRQA